MTKTICYIVTGGTRNYFNNKIMGNDGYYQIWRVRGKFNSYGNLVEIWDEGYMCNVSDDDKFLKKSEHYNAPILRDGKDWEEIQELVEPRFYY